MVTFNLENPKCKKCGHEKPVFNFNTTFMYCNCETTNDEELIGGGK